MRETEFDLKTADGTMPVQVFEPYGSPPKGGVILYMDAFGIRPELAGMCRRYAEAGYAVFLPDLYYRLGKSVGFAIPSSAHQQFDPAMARANSATTMVMTIADTGSLVDHVKGRSTFGIDRFGTVGYCMGARHALGAAVCHPDAVMAAACLHGGQMVSDDQYSPHTCIPRLKGAAYFAFAANDETCPDAHKAMIEETIAKSGVRAETEHFAASHGWTFPTRWCHDPLAAARVQERVLALFDLEIAGRRG